MNPRSRINAGAFVRRELAGLELSRKARKRIERALAQAFEAERQEIARMIEGTWGTADWMAVSKAVAARVRSL